jgi:uncharacterized protein (TIGR02145 family)
MKNQRNNYLRLLILMEIISWFLTINISQGQQAGSGTIADIDGNYYNTVTIGSQVWMAENLRTTRYNDGTPIPLDSANLVWIQSTPGYCWYDNNFINKDLYGALYKWYVVNEAANGGKNVCPAGWFVPNDAEWYTLLNYLGGKDVAGGKMKETGTTHWISPNSGATNESGFTALPGGNRGQNHDASFSNIGVSGYWWSSEDTLAYSGEGLCLLNNSILALKSGWGKEFGFSVRCMQNTVPTISTSAIYYITTISALCSGDIISDGGSPITARGVCWSTSENPTVEMGTKTSDGTGVGSFTSSLTGLTYSTTYHVRAYATNSSGTGYGEDLTFTTPQKYQIQYISGDNQTYSGGIMPLPMVFAVYNIIDNVWVTNLEAENISLNATASTGYQNVVFNNNSDYCNPGENYCFGGYYYIEPNTGQPFTLKITVALKRGNQDLSVFTLTENITKGITPPTIVTNYVSWITSNSAICVSSVTDDGGATVTARGVCWSTSPEPTVDLVTKTTDGYGTGSFISSITGISAGTTYYLRAYATNSQGTAYGNEDRFRTYNADAIQDVEGNWYNIVTIGSQVWMAENLRTTMYSDGTSIPLVTDNTEWAALTQPGYCWYNNNEATYKDSYGALYNWYAVDAESNGGKNVCPAGWQVPTDAEWTILTTYVGGESVAGGMLKETGTTHWTSPNTGATDQFGFTALPSGLREYNGTFGFIGGYGAWWSSTVYADAYGRQMNYNASYVVRFSNSKRYGLSVRCLKEVTSQQSIDLTQGWNILSFAVQPSDMTMRTIVDPLINAGTLIKIQDENGNAVEKLPDPIGWIDNIGQMAVTEGYKIKVTENTIPGFSGTPVTLPLDISLTAGWNIIGYPVLNSQSASAIFSPLIADGSLLKVQDEQGNAIEQLQGPIGWIDNIVNLMPGKGYKVKTSFDTKVTISSSGKGESPISRSAIVQPTHFKPCYKGNGLDHMNIYVKSPTVGSVGLKPGDEIGVFDGDLCVGASVFDDLNRKYLPVIVSLDDPTTQDKDGFTEGN